MKLQLFAKVGREERRGAVVPMFAFMLVGLFGTIAFVADVGNLVVVRSTLSAAADAAALAGAGAMAQSYNMNVVEQTAVEYGQLNVPANYGTVIDAGSVTMGKWDAATKTFTATNIEPNAVRVIAHRTEDRGNAIPYFFARIFGLENTDMTVQAIAAGANNTSALLPSNIYSVYVTSTKDLSNVILHFADGTWYKYDNQSGYAKTYESDKEIIGVWIKSGSNHSSGGPPGSGEYVALPPNYDGTTVHGKNAHKGSIPHVTATFQASGAEFTSSGTSTPVRLVQ